MQTDLTYQERQEIQAERMRALERKVMADDELFLSMLACLVRDPQGPPRGEATNPRFDFYAVLAERRKPFQAALQA
ncbi:MAG: hypothetical protein M3P43_10365, partial [Actinomycetota bacterium]|nr:hypothetical protein [Actinomycetota bacterium]